MGPLLNEFTVCSSFTQLSHYRSTNSPSMNPSFYFKMQKAKQQKHTQIVATPSLKPNTLTLMGKWRAGEWLRLHYPVRAVVQVCFHTLSGDTVHFWGRTKTRMLEWNPSTALKLLMYKEHPPRTRVSSSSYSFSSSCLTGEIWQRVRMRGRERKRDLTVQHGFDAFKPTLTM